MNLDQKVIAITGAARGLGLSMAKVFAAKGAQLALIDVNQDRLKEVEESFSKAGIRAKAYAVDITDEDTVITLFEMIVQDFGTLNGLVNNAGITRDGMLIKVVDGAVVRRMSLKNWNAVINVNLTGTFLCGREAAAQMVEHNAEGVIINISSIAKAGNYGQSNYSAAKAGVAALSVTWAKELSRHNIRVAAIAPGFIATEMTASMRDDVIEETRRSIPLKRFGSPEEIAETAVTIFENDYITGRVLEIDGGMRL